MFIVGTVCSILKFGTLYGFQRNYPCKTYMYKAFVNFFVFSFSSRFV